jgi:NAD(P)-dependent dehydrogenase (short-subunit alcohol dehydrogenase family)
MAEGQHAGRVALVTGGGSGIGRATAERLGAEGARVVIADLDSAAAESVAKQIVEAGGEAFACSVDVSRAADNDRMVEETVSRYGALHLVHLNAGIARFSTIVDGDVEVWNAVVNVNLTGVYLGLRAVAKPIQQAGGGSIVATASIAGLMGGLGMPSYYATKHGVVGLVKSAAAEFAPLGIRVNAVCPGVIDTPILGPAHGVPEITDILARGHLLQRCGRPEEVAEVVSFLLSERASFATGVAWPVDGGLVATIGTPGDDDETRAQLENILGS